MKALRFFLPLRKYRVNPVCVSLLLALGVFAAKASAFTLEPMATLLAPSGAGSVATFRVKNDGSERIAIRLTTLTRAISPDGVETNNPTDSLFRVFPSRLLIEPGATAVAKVQWRGPARLDEERSFRLLAEEVTIDPAADTSSGIKMRFRYLASLYVGSTSFEPKLEAKIQGAEGPKGEKGFDIEIRNVGTRHVVARDLTIALTKDKTEFSIPSQELGGLNGVNYLVDTVRKCFIPSSGSQVGQSYDAQLRYESEY